MKAALMSVPWIPCSMSWTNRPAMKSSSRLRRTAAGGRRCRSRCRGRSAARSRRRRLQSGVAAEQHRGRLDDGLDSVPLTAALVGERLLVLVLLVVAGAATASRHASSRERKCSWISVRPSSSASIAPFTPSRSPSIPDPTSEGPLYGARRSAGRVSVGKDAAATPTAGGSPTGARDRQCPGETGRRARRAQGPPRPLPLPQRAGRG